MYKFKKKYNHTFYSYRIKDVSMLDLFFPLDTKSFDYVDLISLQIGYQWDIEIFESLRKNAELK